MILSAVGRISNQASDLECAESQFCLLNIYLFFKLHNLELWLKRLEKCSTSLILSWRRVEIQTKSVKASGAVTHQKMQ